MATRKIQSGDKVKVISGSYKGQVGTVTSVVKKTKSGVIVLRATVSGLPQITNYRRANSAFNVPGQMNLVDRKIDISNLSLIDDTGKVSKVTIQKLENGSKVRVFKSSNTVVPPSNLTKKTKEITNNS